MHTNQTIAPPSILAYILFSIASASELYFSTDATLHDYLSYADGRAEGNPPWCEVSYNSLDLDSVTAYCDIDKTTCGTCLNVCGSNGCKYLLAIDRCTRSDGLLDISTGAGGDICGSETGHHQVTVEKVSASNCLHIW